MSHFSIILAGGSGTRLWPLSRQSHPKQLLQIEGGHSLLQNTASRLLKFVPAENIYTVTHQDHAPGVVSHFESINPQLVQQVMSEPIGKNTLPAISWAVAVIHKSHPQAVVSVFPSDHVIADEENFKRSVALAQGVAEKGLVTLFGIQADHPSTEYGYIQSDRDVAGFAEGRVKLIKRFVEKPDADTARGYLREGGYFWNSGMFVFRADIYMGLLKKHQPEVYELARQLADQSPTTGDRALYDRFPNISIDYGLMEHLHDAVVIPVNMGWDDLGGWDAVFSYLRDENKENVARGTVYTLESRDNLLWNDDPQHALVTFGVEDLIVIHAQGVTMVCPRKKAPELKKLVGLMKEKRPNLI